MGILDDMTGAMDRGVAAVGRSTKSAQLKMQLSELAKRRRDAAAVLGESLYEETKANMALRQGREELYDAIAAIDSQSADLNAQIEELEKAATMAAETAPAVKCPRCGTGILEDDMFCCGCGVSAEIARAEAAAKRPAAGASGISCPQCGNIIKEGHMFCSGCGMSAEAAREAIPNSGSMVAQPESDVSESPVCPSCGAQIMEGDAFCMTCGAKIVA